MAQGALNRSGPTPQRGVVIRRVDGHRDEAVVVLIVEERADDLIRRRIHVAQPLAGACQQERRHPRAMCRYCKLNREVLVPENSHSIVSADNEF